MTIDWILVLAATLSSFLLGGLWYGPMFGESWARSTGLSPEQLESRPMGKVFALAFLLSLLAAINLAFFLGPEPSLAFGAGAGFAAGLGWVAAFLGIICLFEARPLAGYLINAGYCVVALTAMGAILAL